MGLNSILNWGILQFEGGPDDIACIFQGAMLFGHPLCHPHKILWYFSEILLYLRIRFCNIFNGKGNPKAISSSFSHSLMCFLSTYHSSLFPFSLSPARAMSFLHCSSCNDPKIGLGVLLLNVSLKIFKFGSKYFTT